MDCSWTAQGGGKRRGDINLPPPCRVHVAWSCRELKGAIVSLWHGRNHSFLSGKSFMHSTQCSLAIFSAIRCASSFVSSLATDRPLRFEKIRVLRLTQIPTQELSAPHYVDDLATSSSTMTLCWSPK